MESYLLPSTLDKCFSYIRFTLFFIFIKFMLINNITRSNTHEGIKEDSFRINNSRC